MKTLLIIRAATQSMHGRQPDGRIIERNLGDGSIPYLSEPWIEAAYTLESAPLTLSGTCSRYLTR